MIDEKKQQHAIIASLLNVTDDSHFTETEDESGTVKHVGSSRDLHMQVILARVLSVLETELTKRHQVAEIERTKRQLGLAAVALLALSSLILAFASHGVDKYIAASFLLIAAGVVGYSSIKIKVPGLELSAEKVTKPLDY